MSRMTLSDRIEIEAGIYARKSLSEISERIHKSRRHVSEELRRNATKIPGEHPLGKRCHNATGCRRSGLCGKENCRQMCCTCKEVDCQTVCKAYALVEGSKPYEVEFEYCNGEIRGLVCSCFCACGCKHEVAAMLQLQETLKQIETHYRDEYERTGYFAAVHKGTLFAFAVDSRETGRITL